jgi:hypothetical protein
MKKIFCLFMMCLAFAACNRDRNNNPFTNAKTAADERDLQGKNFTSECSLKPMDAVFTAIATGFSASVKSSLEAYRFDGANVTRMTRFYQSPDCSGDAAVNFEEMGDFNLHKDQQTADLGRAIDIDYHTLKVQTLTNEGVAAANAIGLCGISDWSVNQQRDVTAQAKDVKCLGTPLPRHNANIYRVDAGVLYLGASTANPTDPSQRPTSLSATKYRAL